MTSSALHYDTVAKLYTMSCKEQVGKQQNNGRESFDYLMLLDERMEYVCLPQSVKSALEDIPHILSWLIHQSRRALFDSYLNLFTTLLFTQAVCLKKKGTS